jgi:hypothetical protein
MENLKQFIALCFFKQHRPDIIENTSISSALLFYSVVAIAIQSNFHGALLAAIATCLEILLTFGFIGLCVFSNKLLEEFIPLSCMVFICTGFIASLCIPFILMLYIIKGKLALFLYYSIVAIIIWNILVIRSLFKHSLLISSMRSFTLAMCYFILSYVSPFLIML